MQAFEAQTPFIGDTTKFVYYNPTHPARMYAGSPAESPTPVVQNTREGAAAMKNLQDVLQEKESALLRVREEIEALLLVAPMLVETSEHLPNPETPSRNRWPLDIEESRESSTG